MPRVVLERHKIFYKFRGVEEVWGWQAKNSREEETLTVLDIGEISKHIGDQDTRLQGIKGVEDFSGQLIL